jgi:hypothetical protein
VTKLTLSVRVAVWIRETGSGPPTHVRANSEPAASRAPPKALTSPTRGAPHTDEYGSLEPEPHSYVYGHLNSSICLGRGPEGTRENPIRMTGLVDELERGDFRVRSKICDHCSVATRLAPGDCIRKSRCNFQNGSSVMSSEHPSARENRPEHETEYLPSCKDTARNERSNSILPPILHRGSVLKLTTV